MFGNTDPIMICITNLNQQTHVLLGRSYAAGMLKRYQAYRRVVSNLGCSLYLLVIRSVSSTILTVSWTHCVAVSFLSDNFTAA